MKGYIYMILFPDSKFYIGSTIRDIRERLWEHKKCVNENNVSKRNQPLYLHWRNFEIESIIIEIIETIECQLLNELHERESYYINLNLKNADCLNCCRSFNTKDDITQWKQNYRQANYEKLKAYDTEWHRKKRNNLIE